MRILHAADLHLGTPFRGHSDCDVAELKKQLLSIPAKLTELCKAHHCQMMLLAGDLFDGQPSADSVLALKNALREATVPVFISPGNHDFYNQNSPYFSESWPENVHIFTQSTMQSVAVPALDCRVYGAGYHSMDCGPLLENFRTEGSEAHHIGLLHSDPTQANTPYCPITQAQVAASGLTYLALGHIHKAGSFTAGETLCAWPGCPMGRGYDETGEKGVYLVELGEKASLKFLPLHTLRFYDQDILVTDDPAVAVAAALPPVGNDHFYRFTLRGEVQSFDVSALSFPQFPHLQLRDHTTPPADLWGCISEDTLEGNFFRILHDSLENDEEIATLAAKISRKILDGQEVVLP